MIQVDELLANPPELHEHAGGLTNEWRLDDASVKFLDAHLHDEHRTVETGAGLSTIVFALKRTRHTCIVPDVHLVGRIRSYCSGHGIPLDRMRFVSQPSEYALPQLTDVGLDLGVIDGRHGFPAPFLDWFYIADRLRNGGIVLVDDLHIWTCEVLVEFMKADPAWRQTVKLPRGAAFIKIRDGSEHEEWTNQPFVYAHSRGAADYVAGPACATLLNE